MKLASRRWIRSTLLASVIVCGFITKADPQAIRLSKLTVKPNLVCVLCALTVTASPSSVTFILVQGGVASGSSAVAITTTMSGITAYNSINLFAYFASASAALTDGSTVANNILSSSVLGLMPTGTPNTVYTQFTQSGLLGTPGATLPLFSVSSLTGSGCPPLTTCRTDNLFLEINLSNQLQLPAGIYTGTLILQAEVL